MTGYRTNHGRRRNPELRVGKIPSLVGPPPRYRPLRRYRWFRLLKDAREQREALVRPETADAIDSEISRRILFGDPKR